MSKAAKKSQITADTRGIIPGLPNSVYHENSTHLSSSVLKKALGSPLEFYEQYILGKPTEVSRSTQDNFDLGNLIHAMLLEPETVHNDFAFYTGAVRNGRAWDAFQLENSDKIIMTSSQKYVADKLAEQFAAQELALPDGTLIKGPQLFQKGVPEESIFTEIDGLPIKVRPDYRVESKGLILDLKTCGGCPNTVSEARSIVNGLMYQLSAALYVDALKEVTGKDYDFLWVFLSKTDYKLNVYKASPDTLAQGRDLYRQAIESIKYWKASGNYTKVSQIREL